MKTRIEQLLIAVACLSCYVSAQSVDRIPVASAPSLSPGGTIEIETGRVRAQLLKPVDLVPIAKYPDQKVDGSQLRVELKHVSDSAQVSAKSAISASASARYGAFRANFSAAGETVSSVKRTSQYIIAHAQWTASSLVFPPEKCVIMDPVNYAAIGNRVVVGVEFGGELRIVIEMAGASHEQASRLEAALNAKGFGYSADVSLSREAKAVGYSGSMSLSFSQSGGPKFVQPTPDTIAKQVFEWANEVRQAPQPAFLLLQDASNFLPPEKVEEFKARAALMRLFGRRVESCIALLDKCMVDRETLMSVASNASAYVTADWTRWRSEQYEKAVLDVEKTYTEVYNLMRDQVDALASGKDAAVALPAYSPPSLPTRASDGMVAQTFESRLVPVGTIVPFAGQQAPEGWLLCDGRQLDEGRYAALAAVLGRAYDRDGKPVALPDLRGRVPVGAGQGGSLSDRPIGSQGGSEAVVLTTAQMPKHSHGTSEEEHRHYWASDPFFAPGGGGAPRVVSPHLRVSSGGVGRLDLTGVAPPVGGAKANVKVLDEGGGQPHDNMPPFLVTNYIIKY